ncbi:MAG: ribonuclease P protein component [Chthoniobacterales bacterium]
MKASIPGVTQHVITEVKLQAKATLPREARLRYGYQYDSVHKKGISVHGALFRLACLSPSDVSPTQCGIITSRRVGGAVVRNKIKRRLRTLYRLDRNLIIPGLWIVIIAKSKASTASLADLRAEWVRLGKRLSIFKNEQPLFHHLS